MGDPTQEKEIEVFNEPNRDEGRLLEALRDGDDAAYELLIERYQQPVYNLVYRLVDDPSEAADVVQEVFLKVFRNIGSLRATAA